MPSSLPHPPAVLRRPTGVVSRSGTTQSATPVLPPTTSVAFPGTSVTAPTPTLTAATPVPLSLHDRRERNKAASAKYRAKKHVQSSEMRQQIQVLQEQNRLLTRQLEESRAENTSLKSLVERLKSRIVAQKVLKRLRRVGRDRASSVTTASSGTTTTAPNGTRKRGFGRASGGSHSTNEPAYESIESGMDEDSQDTEIDELEDTLLAQDDDDDDDFDISSQFSDDSEFDDHVERSRRIKRQRRSSKSSAGATKIGSTDFTTDALPSPRRSSASSTGSIESSVSPNTVPSDPSPIVPDLHFE
ncbi:hypothetical protein BGW42_004504 [Actinomortierella wolfii]|nr:hypothetical protein BGW42_004504 [Actinomortierella wolfii]